MTYPGILCKTDVCGYAGRYLFDLGTSYYNTSLSWVTDRYRDLGVEFDEIWAWEVSELVPTCKLTC